MNFKKLSKQEIERRLNKRKVEIKNTDKLPPLNTPYLSFISKYEGVEITPDIKIFGYEEALKENRYLAANYPVISQIVWMIGVTGQGDEWFIHKNNSNILFYDHDQGEYSDITQFVSLNIEFFDFLQMAFLYQDLENLLDKEDNIDKIPINTFITAINSIYPNLYELYPFRYLE